MDRRPPGYALLLWLAAVLAVAACNPRGDDRAANDPDALLGRMAEASREAPRAADAARPDTARMGAAQATAPSGDAQITAQVRAALAAAQDLRGARIDVDTRDGVVTLSGSVPTAAIKARATEIAKATQAVRDVNDQLTMTSD